MTNKGAQPRRVVQLSDCHLFADTEGKLLGLNTRYSLERVIERVREEQPDMELILATGDLSQDGSRASYERLRSMLEPLDTPVLWLEGNHDKPEPMLEVLADQRERVSPCYETLGNWTIIMLDSTIPDKVPGELYEHDLEFLERALNEAPGEHIMVCLHHHPVAIGCAWLDTQVVASGERFFEILDRHPRVRAVVWGHIHQEYEAQRNGVELFAVPSTCVQFEPFSEDFSVDDANPGYRWFDLYDDGRLETGISRVEGIDFQVDFSVKGY